MPVWRPAFQAGSAMRGRSETRFAGLRPACRSKDRRSRPARHHGSRAFRGGGAMRGSSETRFAGLRPGCRSEDRRSQRARHHGGRTFRAGGAISAGRLRAEAGATCFRAGSRRARRGAPRVPVWRPAFQAGSAIPPIGRLVVLAFARSGRAAIRDSARLRRAVPV